MGLLRRSPTPHPSDRGSADGGVDRLSRQELAGLVTAARAVNDAGDIEAILSTILTEAIRLLDADEGSVMLYDPPRTRLEIRAAKGLPPDIVDDVSVKPGEGIAGYVATSGEALLLADDDVDDYATGRERARQLRSAVCVPLRARGVVEGVLNVNVLQNNDGHTGFTERDRELATLFAEHAAAAVHNRQLVDQAHRRRDELGRLFEVGYALSASLDVGEVTHHILEAAGELVGAEAGYVCVLGEEGNGPEVGVYEGLTRGRVMASMRRPAFTELLRTSGPRVVDEPQSHDCLAPLVENAGRLVGDAGGHGGRDADHTDRPTAVVVPLSADGATRGLLVALVPGAAPDDSELRLLNTYATHASMALAKALAFRGLRTKERELESLVHAVPNPMIVADGGGRFVTFNIAAAEQFGLNPQFDSGASIAGKLRSDELEQLVFSEHGGRSEITLYNPEPRTYRVRVDLVRPEHGPAGARILILEDVTSEKQTAQAQTDFVSVISHELRTPLTLIKGYASTMSRRSDLDPETRQQATQAVHAHAVRLERLIEDLLFVANIERGTPPMTLERHDLVELVEKIVRATSREEPDRSVRLRSSLTQLAVEVDATKVEQILHHLIDNALKFSEAPDPVQVSLELDADEVVIEVTDHGVGIFSGDLPDLFDRFHQADGTATRQHGGTGVGLYICRTLAEAHGGRVDVRSALGKGSTFTLRLPRYPSDELQAPDAQGRRPAPVPTTSGQS